LARAAAAASGLGAAGAGAGAAAGFDPRPIELKSRSDAGSTGAGLAAGFAAAGAGFAAAAAAGLALAMPGDTSRMKPSLSSWVMSCWKPGSKGLPTFSATSASVARPSIAASTARSGRLSRLVLPAASWTPFPDFE
jgi:hypothetical protein